MRFGLNTIVLPEWEATRDFVQTAEGLGFDSFLLPDHPAQHPSANWSMLGALAASTRTIRLGTLVSCASYLHPVPLARMVADVDRISGGRAVLGLGSGDESDEFRQMGLPYEAPARQAALEEALQVIGPLLRGDQVAHRGAQVQVDSVTLRPPALQQPYVPIVLGGGSKHTLRLAARYADGINVGAASWAGNVTDPDRARATVSVLRDDCHQAGRPFEAILRTVLVGLFLSESPVALQEKMGQIPPPLLAAFERIPVVGTPEQAVARVRSLVDAGFQYVFFIVLPFDAETLRLAVERVIPAITGASTGTQQART
jgi:alkanesulfonate monooxygenase SsuD/methylene tetrahydromethanopterin reductase-like flavin-dependent oxidoreductase (luciferase family)